MLSLNPNAITILEKNVDKINWMRLSANPNAIRIFEQHPDKVEWWMFPREQNNTPISKSHFDEISRWEFTDSPHIIEFLNAVSPYDYDAIKKHCNVMINQEELAMKVYHPRHVIRHLDDYNYNLCEDEYYD
jgi:hypothetical protein